jgi:hypothetical protein
MSTRTRTTATLFATFALAALAVLCPPALAARRVSPLPASDYSVRSVCATPTPGHAGCLAMKLVPLTAAARAHSHPLGMTRSTTLRAGRTSEPCEVPSAAEGCYGLRPQDLHSAYQLPTSAATTQTLALVDVYNDLHAEADLRAYDTEFDLPQCTEANGCFKQVNQRGATGEPPFPATQTSLEKEEALCRSSEPGHANACKLVEEALGWGVESSLDVETAHATCQSCHIVLVEASSSSFANLDEAEAAAERVPANEISNSWGGPECETVSRCVSDSSVFKDPGVVITASAGDDGYLNWLEGPASAYADYPASSPHVVAVGGTRLYIGESGERTGESVWNDGGESGGHSDGHGAGGGGCSIQFEAPPWQQSVSDWSAVGCGNKRAVADVAADADPYTGLAVYDASPECEEQYEEENENEEVVLQTSHWCTIGGTSLASPLIASVFALAGGAHGVEYPARTLYENAAETPASLHDVSEGSNGKCGKAFDAGTASTACIPAEEAQTSCSGKLICLAGSGYDGPTGVGTPDGIGAFQPPPQAPGSGQGETPAGSGAGNSAAVSPPVTPTDPGPSVASSPPSPQLSALALTLKAVIALNTSRPKIAAIGFTFLSNANVRVLVSLQKRVGKGRHARWLTLAHPRALAALAGRNVARLSGHGSLSSGAYRLMLTPAHGAARSLVFKIG